MKQLESSNTKPGLGSSVWDLLVWIKFGITACFKFNSVMCNSSISQVLCWLVFFFFILFCIAFVHSSLLSNFLGPLRLKGVFAWLPELSAVIQKGQKVLKRAVRYFFPVYSTVYTLLQSSRVSQHFPENVMWRMVPVRKEMEGLY